MTKEELKQEAEDYALKQWEGNLPWSVIQKSYYDGALPREKQIEIDAKQIRALQKQNEELTDELAKAKDHIKKLLGCLQQDTNDPQTNYYVVKYMTEAEQFLKNNA